MVAQQTLDLFVGVRILPGELEPGNRYEDRGISRPTTNAIPEHCEGIAREAENLEEIPRFTMAPSSIG